MKKSEDEKPEKEKSSNGEAPFRVIDLYCSLRLMLQDLALLTEAVKNRDLLETSAANHCFGDVVNACVDECRVLCTEGKRQILESYPDDSRFKEIEENAPDPTPGKMEDRGQAAKA